MTPIGELEPLRDASTVGMSADFSGKAGRLLVLVLFILLASPAFADGPKKKSKDLDKINPESTVDVIVQFNQAPTEAQHQKIRDKGGVLKKHLDVVKGALYSVPASKLDELAADPDVFYISPDRRVQGSLDYTSAAVNAPVAWNSYALDGSGIGVAVIDSGIANVADLKNWRGNSRIIYNQDFTGLGTYDDLGHGTHVAGIMGSNGKNSSCYACTRNFRGIAPNVQFINLRVLDRDGQGNDSSVIAAINRAIGLQSQYNVRVINLSLGRPVFESYSLDPLCQAVEAAWRAGIVVVVAAGNLGRYNYDVTNGYGSITAPGNDPYVITVGAMKTNSTFGTSDDTIASYSSKGPTLIDHVVKPDIVAPGNRVVSVLATASQIGTLFPQNYVPLSYYQTTTSISPSNTYFTLSGTSMATPVVSGAAALLVQQNPSLTPDQVKARLMKTAAKAFPASSISIDPITGAIYTSYYDIFTIGAGYLDIAAALGNNDLATGSAMSPTAVYDLSAGTVSLLTDSSVVWGTSLVWGTSVVWGSNVFVNGTAVLWGSSLVWGTSSTEGFSVIWGTSVVWGTCNQTSTEALSVSILGER